MHKLGYFPAYPKVPLSTKGFEAKREFMYDGAYA